MPPIAKLVIIVVFHFQISTFVIRKSSTSEDSFFLKTNAWYETKMTIDTIKASLEAIDAPQMLHVYEKADIEM